MVELEGVADAARLGCAIYDLAESVVVEGRANAEPVTGA